MPTRHQEIVTYCTERGCTTPATSICPRCGGGLCASHDQGADLRCGSCELFFEESNPEIQPRFRTLVDEAGVLAFSVALIGMVYSLGIAYLLHESPIPLFSAILGPSLSLGMYLKYDKTIKTRRAAKRRQQARLDFLEDRKQLPPAAETDTNTETT